MSSGMNGDLISHSFIPNERAASSFSRTYPPEFSPMRRIVVLILLIAGAAAAWSQGTYRAAARSTELHIDGAAQDWPEAAWTWHRKAPVRYALAYDDSALYLAWTSEDAHWLNQVLMTGLVCRLEPQNRRRLTRSVRFPVGVNPQLRPTDPNRLARYLYRLQTGRPELLATMQGVELIDFVPQRDTLWTDAPQDLGVQVGASFDERGRTLTIEYRVALAQLPQLSAED